MLQKGEDGPAALPQEQGRKKDGGLKAGQGLLHLQSSEVGRSCGHQPRDTVTLLSFSVVPAADMPFCLSR